jgi:hypothetical protein
MPHFESLPPIENIAPEDLLPPTPKRGPKPPVQKTTGTQKATERFRHKLLPRISIKNYRPSIEQEQHMDDLLRESTS